MLVALTGAGSAVAECTALPVDVGNCVGSTEAMAIDAMRLDSVACRNRPTAQKVRLLRHRLKVIRVDTSPVLADDRAVAIPRVAGVVDGHAVRDRRDEDLVGDPMREFELALVPETPVAGVDQRGRPQPAAGGSDLGFGQEPLLDCKRC